MSSITEKETYKWESWLRWVPGALLARRCGDSWLNQLNLCGESQLSFCAAGVTEVLGIKTAPPAKQQNSCGTCPPVERAVLQETANQCGGSPVTLWLTLLPQGSRSDNYWAIRGKIFTCPAAFLEHRIACHCRVEAGCVIGLIERCGHGWCLDLTPSQKPSFCSHTFNKHLPSAMLLALFQHTRTKNWNWTRSNRLLLRCLLHSKRRAGTYTLKVMQFKTDWSVWTYMKNK